MTHRVNRPRPTSSNLGLGLGLGLLSPDVEVRVRARVRLRVVIGVEHLLSQQYLLNRDVLFSYLDGRSTTYFDLWPDTDRLFTVCGLWAASGFCGQRQRHALWPLCLHHRFNAVLNSWVHISRWSSQQNMLWLYESSSAKRARTIIYIFYC